MAKKTAFQMLLGDACALAKYIAQEYSGILPFPEPESTLFYETLADAVMLYLSGWLQSDLSRKKSVYQFVEDHYGYTAEKSKRQFYRNENMIRRYAGRQERGKRRLYDEADFISIQNRVEKGDPLTELASRRRIHSAKYVPNSRLAKAYQEYDEEYRYAAMETDDEKHMVNSIYFYRKERALAFALIAGIADYMCTSDYKELDYDTGKYFWTDILVDNMDWDDWGRRFRASANVLTYHRYIPIVFSALPDKIVKKWIHREYAVRTLKQNVFERLPPAEKYGSFDRKEIADFIRQCYPLIESHRPVSFYADELCTQVDAKKIRLARVVMQKLYSFAGETDNK